MSEAYNDEKINELLLDSLVDPYMINDKEKKLLYDILTCNNHEDSIAVPKSSSIFYDIISLHQSICKSFIQIKALTEEKIFSERKNTGYFIVSDPASEKSRIISFYAYISEVERLSCDIAMIGEKLNDLKISAENIIENFNEKICHAYIEKIAEKISSSVKISTDITYPELNDIMSKYKAVFCQICNEISLSTSISESADKFISDCEYYISAAEKPNFAKIYSAAESFIAKVEILIKNSEKMFGL